MAWWKKLFNHKPPAPQRRPCYIKFEVGSVDALNRLTTIVDALKADKAAEKGRSDEEWELLFLPSELETFWRPDDQERQAWSDYWFATPLPKRHSPEMPTPPWHLGTMVEAIIEHHEYDLIGVRMLNDCEAVLEFDPHGHPYGGTGALRALVRAFGHRVVGTDDGTGYEAGDPQPPRWTREMQP